MLSILALFISYLFLIPHQIRLIVTSLLTFFSKNLQNERLKNSLLNSKTARLHSPASSIGFCSIPNKSIAPIFNDSILSCERTEILLKIASLIISLLIFLFPLLLSMNCTDSISKDRKWNTAVKKVNIKGAGSPQSNEIFNSVKEL